MFLAFVSGDFPVVFVHFAVAVESQSRRRGHVAEAARPSSGSVVDTTLKTKGSGGLIHNIVLHYDRCLLNGIKAAPCD